MALISPNFIKDATLDAFWHLLGREGFQIFNVQVIWQT